MKHVLVLAMLAAGAFSLMPANTAEAHFRVSYGYGPRYSTYRSVGYGRGFGGYGYGYTNRVYATPRYYTNYNYGNFGYTNFRYNNYSYGYVPRTSYVQRTYVRPVVYNYGYSRPINYSVGYSGCNSFSYSPPISYAPPAVYAPAIAYQQPATCGYATSFDSAPLISYHSGCGSAYSAW